MKDRKLHIDNLPRVQQALLVAVALVAALFIGSILYLLFAIPNHWLTPEPRNIYERNIIAAQNAVVDAKRQFGTGVTDDGRTPYVDAQAQLILVRLEAGQIERAHKNAEKLFGQHPENPYVIYAYAQALFSFEQYVDAGKVVSGLLDQVATLPPDLQRSVYQLQAQLYLRSERIDDAITMLMKAAAVPPASIEHYMQAGDLAVTGAMWEKAAQAYASALAYNPTSHDIQSALSIIRTGNSEAFAEGVRAASSDTGINVEELLR